MKVEARDVELKYPRKIKEEKTRIIVDWLNEFRFSTIEILSSRIGSKEQSQTRFFAALQEEKIIKPFESLHARGEKYVMLGPIGKEIALANGRSLPKNLASSKKLVTYSKIYHDICLQKVIVSNIGRYDEVIWDMNITDHGEKRPDALVRYPKGYWVAIEFERIEKTTARIYLEYEAHMKAIGEGKYAGVYYVFHEESDMLRYKRLFDETVWPKYKQNSKKGSFKPEKIGEVRIDAHDQIRKFFIFSKFGLQN